MTLWRVRIPAMITLGLLLLALLRTAWVCDDAFISFAHFANLFSGDGLTYQPGDRVQAFSNPLWTLLVGMLYRITGESWMTSMLLGVVLSLGAAVLLIRPWQARDLRALWLALALLLSSAFVDFGTSGLENSLSYLLVVLFARQFFTENLDLKALFWLCFWAGLAMFNRLDLVLLLGPACAWAWFQVRDRRKWGWTLLAFAPFLLWEAFALWYYGFLLPNTWYAKLGAGDGRGFLLKRGLVYLRDTLGNDPVTGFGLLVAGAWSAWVGDRKVRLLVLGLALYLLAVTLAGGDFMRGRMFAVPFLLGVVLLAQVRWPRRWAWVALPALLLVGLIRADSPVWSGPHYHQGRSEDPEYLYPDNIVDERAMYYSRTGMWANHGEEVHPMRVLERTARANRAARKTWQGSPKVRSIGAAGFLGYTAEPGVIFIDILGLADPLLARLPATRTFWWRAGHYSRMLPAGYRAYRASGNLQLEDAALQEYMLHLQELTRGDLWSGQRLRRIFGFLLGQEGREIDRMRYREAYLLRQAGSGPYRTTEWRPLRLRWDRLQHPAALNFSLKAGGPVRLEIRRGGFSYGHLHLSQEAEDAPNFKLALPALLQSRGFDELWFWPEGGGASFTVEGI